VAISEALKKDRFINHLLKEVGVKVEIPMVKRCDNVVAIFMAVNLSILITLM
jgi:hypothetical protein